MESTFRVTVDAPQIAAGLLIILHAWRVKMVELHGWLSISETYGDEDLVPEKCLKKIRSQVKQILDCAEHGMALHNMNGIPYVNASFSSNHRTKEVDEIVEVYKEISKIATGSYGVIYLRDDEDKEHGNDFLRITFRKGQCNVKVDEDFSPCNPKIEASLEDLTSFVKRLCERLKIQPVGEGFTDMICPPEHVAEFISACTENDVQIEGFTWWCHVSEGHVPCGMGGPKSQYYDGWFSEIQMDEMISFPSNEGYEKYLIQDWKKSEDYKECYWPGFWVKAVD